MSMREVRREQLELNRTDRIRGFGYLLSRREAELVIWNCIESDEIRNADPPTRAGKVARRPRRSFVQRLRDFVRGEPSEPTA